MRVFAINLRRCRLLGKSLYKGARCVVCQEVTVSTIEALTRECPKGSIFVCEDPQINILSLYEFIEECTGAAVYVHNNQMYKLVLEEKKGVVMDAILVKKGIFLKVTKTQFVHHDQHLSQGSYILEGARIKCLGTLDFGADGHIAKFYVVEGGFEAAQRGSTDACGSIIYALARTLTPWTREIGEN